MLAQAGSMLSRDEKMGGRTSFETWVSKAGCSNKWLWRWERSGLWLWGMRRSYEPGKVQVSGGKSFLGTIFSLHRLSVAKSHQAAPWRENMNHPSGAGLLGASWIYPPFGEDGGDKLKVVRLLSTV